MTDGNFKTSISKVEWKKYNIIVNISDRPFCIFDTSVP